MESRNEVDRLNKVEFTKKNNVLKYKVIMIILIIQKDKESRPEKFDFVNISETFCWNIIISNLFSQSSISARSGNKLITRQKSEPIFVISTIYNFTVTIRIWLENLRNYFTGSSHECFKFCEKYYQSQFWNYLEYWKSANIKSTESIILYIFNI